MSTRKSTLTSPTASPGTKLENSSTSSSALHNTKALDKTNAVTTTAEKAEMGANTSTNITIVNTSDSKASTEHIQKTNQETKPFQQRVTRSSPLFLASPLAGITIKKEPIDLNDHHTNSESEEAVGTNAAVKKTQVRARKSLKEQKDIAEKEKEDKLDDLESKEKNKEKEEKEEQIEIKEKEITASSTASNRLTRKSLANQEVTNTRVTRQRQSSGASTRSETPPARSRSGRALGRGKMPLPMVDTTSSVTKRKRSADADNSNANKNSIDEPGPKFIKIEVKDPDIENEDLLLSSQNTNASTESAEIPLIKIKEELPDESENETVPVIENLNTPTANSSQLNSIGITNMGRGRGRNPNRKSTANSNASSTSNTHCSPSTRATRQAKHSSPVQSTTIPITETKRRRMGSQTRSLLKTSMGNNSKNLNTHADDEDSKDSMASTNTDDIVLALIKSEKISMEMDDDNTNEAKDVLVAAGEKEKVETMGNLEEASDLPPPLVVDTNVAPLINVENAEIVENAALTPVTASCSSLASGSEKAASLSPSELMSEGVSEISVKQFYKKPKFLENNLGIEEDPKLGNIVQKVAGLETTTTSTTTTPAIIVSASCTATTNPTVTTSDGHLIDDTCSNESLQEGTLKFDENESMEEKKTIVQDDCNSLSSDDNDAPLLIVEDDEEEEDELEDLLENKEADAQVVESLPSQDQLEKELTKVDATKDNELKENVKLKAVEDDNHHNLEKYQDQEDELTLEESETVSMDNNASINDEVITEIEDPANDIDDFTELNDEMENTNDLQTVQDINKTEANNVTIDTLEKKIEAFTNGKEGGLSNDNNEIKHTDICASTADDEDNDVLAKIDAELKKIDERSKKLTISKIEKKLNSADVCQRRSIDVFPATDESMDIDVKVKEVVAEVKNVAKAEAVIDDVVDIKLFDDKPLIKLPNLKQKSEDEEDVGFSSDLDTLLNEEKSDINKKVLLKVSKSNTEHETLNGKTPPPSSLDSSPMKTGLSATVKDDDSTSLKSGQSATSWITLEPDNDDEDTLRKKELHLQNLGLVTHKAAEKRRLEVIQSSAANVEASKVVSQQHHQQQQQQQQNNKRNGKNSSHAASTHQEYTGTLKTIIKINRNSTGGGTSGGNNGRKNQNNAAGSSTTKEQQQQRRQSLKMTFQKGRARAHGTGKNDCSQQDREGHAEDSYYTIQNETEDSSNSESHDHLAGVSNKKDEKEEILIPEKASSFKFHPGRLCEDQCFYCSGKFGLYDTPCHVGQIKSMERQQKILANEEKLTVDNCLCDACFRHVDRRANVPSYKKRLTASGHFESLASTSSKSLENQQYDEQQNADGEANDGLNTNSASSRKCLVPDCAHPAVHSIRRKCIRKSVKKFLLKFEMPTGAACVWLCQPHYDTVIHCSGCVLCKRRLGKNHMYHITSDTDRLEKALCEMGIPVQLGIGTAVCKLCRYFANLLMKPPDSTKSQKAEFVKNYRKRLLQFHNIHDGSNEASEADEDDSNSNSASNHENNDLQKQTSEMEPESDTLTKQKDKNVNSQESLTEKPHNNDNSKSKSDKASPKTIERDFDTAGISTDSSSSSIVSNTASNSANEMSKLKAILQSNTSAEKQPPSADISNVLRANPNISMRELFPGEEDLGLQFKVPFGGSGSQRTPEGWTRVQTFLQYDEPTRRLWEELQKPYGNQSSFLRHLILLEKYFRNGDLVLSASASNNANVYTQTVKQRLTSYDKGHCGGLHMGTGVPKENKSGTVITAVSKSITTKTKEIDPKIPTFVINEDDDDEDSDDQDVEMTAIEKLPKTSSATNLQKETNTNHQTKQQLQRSRSLSVDKLTKQLSSNAVTITARPKDPSLATNSKRATPSPQKSLLKDNLMSGSSTSPSATNPANLVAANAAAAVALAASSASAAAAAAAAGSSNSRSILKCNLLGINKSVEILPISSSANTTITKTSSNSNAPPPPPPPPPAAIPPPVAETKQQKILEVANKLLGNHLEAAAAAAAAANQSKNPTSLLSSPPELVSLQRRSAGQVMPNATASSTNSSSSNSNNNTSQQSSNMSKRPQLLVKPGTSRPPPNVVILPDTLTPQERLQSKTWRPTLMPVEENHNLLNKNGPLYQTADGRRLPALVQVQSGGKPFLISIFDYNRMCILRREKLMRDQMLKATKKRLESKQQQQQQQQVQAQQQQQQQHLQNQQHQQHHQQQQLQKANLQNLNKNYQNPSAAAANQQRQQQHQQQQHHQQQHQQQQQQNAEQQRLLQYQILEHQQALIKAATAALNTPSSQHAAALRYQSILPKPPATSNITTMPPLQAPINTNANFTAPMMPLLANAITNAANTGNVNPASTSTSSHSNTSWLWNNFPDANQLLLNGGASSSGTNVPKLPQLLAKSNNPASTLTNANNAAKLQQQHQQQLQQHQQQQFLLSKIPKSLTVIPQHKLMSNNASGVGNVSGSHMKE